MTVVCHSNYRLSPLGAIKSAVCWFITFKLVQKPQPPARKTREILLAVTHQECNWTPAIHNHLCVFQLCSSDVENCRFSMESSSEYSLVEVIDVRIREQVGIRPKQFVTSWYRVFYSGTWLNHSLGFIGTKYIVWIRLSIGFKEINLTKIKLKIVCSFTSFITSL